MDIRHFSILTAVVKKLITLDFDCIKKSLESGREGENGSKKLIIGFIPNYGAGACCSSELSGIVVITDFADS